MAAARPKKPVPVAEAPPTTTGCDGVGLVTPPVGLATPPVGAAVVGMAERFSVVEQVASGRGSWTVGEWSAGGVTVWGFSV